MKTNKNFWRSIFQRPEMLTLSALLLLLLFNAFFTKGFFKLEIREGHLYGTLIDIIKRRAMKK